MRGLTSTAAGIGLVAAALWLFSSGGANTTVLMCAAGALVLLYRGYQGLTIAESAGDAMVPMEFVSNPRGAIVDLATQQVEKLIDGARGEARDGAAGEQPFDADAAISRYLEKRSEQLPTPTELSPAPRGFGRKGL